MSDTSDLPENEAKPSNKLGSSAAPKPNRWVQTERAAHEDWAKLIQTKPTAAMLMHVLVAHMGHQNAVVISQDTMAELLGKTSRTVRTALKVLESSGWIQVVRMNGPGTVCAYVVNDRVGWGQNRNLKEHVSIFSAQIVAVKNVQKGKALSDAKLRRLPVLFTGEKQLPAGDGIEPPSQPSIPGMEPDLPAITVEEDSEVAQLEDQGQQRLID